MHIPKLIAVLVLPALVVAAPGALAEIYRCEQPGGKIGYQDLPCSGGVQKKVDSPASGAAPVAGPAGAPSTASSPGAAPDYKPQLAELERRRQIRESIASGVPMVSMTRAELNDAMGNPDKVNSGQYGASAQDQLVYYRRGRTLYVYTRDGVVTSIQNTEGAPAARPRGTCGSPEDIRRIELRMSAYMNRDNQALQTELQKQLREARTCQ